ncbi:MAG: helix-turn-helix transcriptional regulator [Bacteroidota bacterium]|nr:helix-turn-helix transcriptional regulator [Bacteroidota bacterium]MDP4232844.1 helix-turn-helix transcriptional regulator [Bacteroidota bacterium]MDP4241888.1 helix-turn-helix transcriptional regulator [Bacteroidota bacterium]MDP4288213.1 helix-turn-helix transcriptional regulator [Bacteroidota bacterium]
MKIRDILAHNLRKYRARSKLTQEQLAWKAKLSPDFIGRVERAERTISLDNIEQIAKVLKIEPHRLLILESDKSD